ncbi:transcription elongation factor GreA [Miltoncostaea marina]|uniref:transcription elongation factor GreA n=1 Tax=Miltoncostaea marina TaxID=2843215 RepID=UPI001C3C5E9C|nr:transcription elongation factor GreA [Miltoncostaea marina]
MATRQRPLEIVLTREGADLLRAELAELVDVARPASLRRVQAACEQGDGEGGPEVGAARWEQSRIEARIARLEDQLRVARIIDAADLDGDAVAPGHRVGVRRADGTEREYVLVSPIEADPAHGRLSVESPLGRALLGRVPGDEVRLPNSDAPVVVTAVGAP